jgi:hypothetical protein
MDVGNGVRAIGPILLLASLHLLAPWAQADPLYTVIDMGTGAPTFGTNAKRSSRRGRGRRQRDRIAND